MKRVIVQFLSAIGVNSYFYALVKKGIYQGNLKGIPFPVLNCYACPFARFACPIGSLQHYSAIRAIPYYLIGIFGVTGFSVGRAPCGWLCPFGFIQDLLYKIRTFKITIPRFFSYFKFAILVIVVILLPYFTGESWFSKVCPVGLLEGGIPIIAWNPQTGGLVGLRRLLGWLYFTKLGILSIIIGLSVISKRPFCRIFCPLGAILALFNKVSLLQVNLKKGDYICEDCNMCRDVCPMDIKIYENLTDVDCIRCGRCVHICPENALYITPSFRKCSLTEPVSCSPDK
ncbi:4Fe-4S binding protein [candidate division WOR-3 bacterium]|nr:4Fe-4S binding protein [candidate division WOR-3 bacterium]